MTIKNKQANQHKTTTTACDRETKNKFSKICSPIISRIPCMFWIIYLILYEKSFSWINEEFCRASIDKKKYNEISSLTHTFENLSFLWKMYSFSEHAYEHLGYASSFFYIFKFFLPKNYSSNAGKSHIHMRKFFLTHNFLYFLSCYKNCFCHFIVNNLGVFPAENFFEYVVCLSCQRQYDLRYHF